MSGKAISIPQHAATFRSVRAHARRTTQRGSLTARDLVLGTAFLLAFPVAVSVPGALADDGVPDRTVPIIERGTP